MLEFAKSGGNSKGCLPSVPSPEFEQEVESGLRALYQNENVDNDSPKKFKPSIRCTCPNIMTSQASSRFSFPLSSFAPLFLAPTNVTQSQDERHFPGIAICAFVCKNQNGLLKTLFNLKYTP